MQDDSIPPRFGMTTSNAAECTNSISLDLRNNEPWLGVIEGMVDIMSTNNSNRRQLYKTKDPEEVVPWVKELLEKQMKAASSMDVIKVEEGRNEFAVTEYYNRFVQEDDDRETETNPLTVKPLIQKKTKNVLYPGTKWCTCGKWQDMKFPCRHAMAYFSK